MPLGNLKYCFNVIQTVDSYNQLVRSVRNYKAQEVAGGVATGGNLGVQGGVTPPATPPAAVSKEAKKSSKKDVTKK